jgi:hypothetical protein
MRLEPSPARTTRCKIKPVPHRPSAPCPLLRNELSREYLTETPADLTTGEPKYDFGGAGSAPRRSARGESTGTIARRGRKRLLCGYTLDFKARRASRNTGAPHS